MGMASAKNLLKWREVMGYFAGSYQWKIAWLKLLLERIILIISQTYNIITVHNYCTGETDYILNRNGMYHKVISASKGVQMERKFGMSPYRNWRYRIETEHGKVR